MKDNKLHWGLISTARINRAVIPPIHKSRRAVLQGVASRDLGRAQEFAQTWKIPQVYGSYEAMLADPEIDIVYNPLPNKLHTEWTLKAVEAGKHVLCEKPLALTADEVDQMIAASQRTGKMIAEAFMYRHHPQTLKVKELVDSGAIGELRLVRGSFSFFLNRSTDVRLNPELGGGSIWDVGCYPISYARYIIGAEPTEVMGWQKFSESGVDDLFVGQMQFPGNVYAQFDCAFCVSFRTGIEISGSEGSITISRPFTPRRIESVELKQGDKTTRILIRSGDLYSGEVEDMHAAILDGANPRVSLQDSHANVQAITALLQSAREGKPQFIGK
jgi:predicted dehydrogenase